MIRLPKNKLDVAAAEEIAQADWAQILPHAYLLMPWTQDPNWPMAHVFSPLFLEHAADLVDLFREILEGSDTDWQESLLQNIIAKIPPTQRTSLVPALQTLATQSPDEHVRAAASEILKSSKS